MFKSPDESTCIDDVSILGYCKVFNLQHQQQVAAAVERAKQVTMTELNAIIGVSNPIVFFHNYRSMPSRKKSTV